MDDSLLIGRGLAGDALSPSLADSAAPTSSAARRAPTTTQRLLSSAVLKRLATLRSGALRLRDGAGERWIGDLPRPEA
jgi:hypothetical protein